MSTTPKLKPDFELTIKQQYQKKKIWQELLRLRGRLNLVGDVGKHRTLLKIESLLQKSIRLGLHFTEEVASEPSLNLGKSLSDSKN